MIDVGYKLIFFIVGWALAQQTIPCWAKAQPTTHKPIELVMWHAMAGPLGQEVDHLAKQFNASQSDYVLKPIYKGNYLETLTAYTAAYRAHHPPAMVQVFEVGRGTMLYPTGVIKPVGQLLHEQNVAWSQVDLWPALNAYYARSGTLEAFPFNVSLPVMYYNADRLKKTGVDAQHFPKTWQEFEQVLVKLKAAGDSCGYTSAYPSWIHLESFQSVNGTRALTAPLPDGRGSDLLAKHLLRLVRWQRAHYFEYAGRYDESTVLFTSGRCAFFTQSSGAYQSLMTVSPFKVGVASIPIDAQATRRSNVVGGGALWVSADLTPQVEKGIALWLTMMLRPETQNHWYQSTGYLPILKQDSTAGILGLVQLEWGKTNQMSQLTSAQNRIRAMNDESLESLLSGLISVEQMMQQLTKNAVYADYRFDKNHGYINYT